MTFARKFNTFGGTNINIYLGNKTQKSNSPIKIPTESQLLIGGGNRSDMSAFKGEGEVAGKVEGEDEGESKVKGEDKSEGEDEEGTAANRTNPVRIGNNQLGTSQLEEVVSTIATEHAEDDAKIDIIEGKLTKNWEKLYVELGKINSDTAYTQQNKSEITQFIQEIVAAALLQTI